VHLEIPGKVQRLATLLPWLILRCRTDELDALLTITTLPNLLGIVAVKCSRWIGRPMSIVITEHSIPSEHQRLHGIAGRLQGLLSQCAYRSADAVIAVSHASAANLIGGFHVRQGRCFVVPLPILDDGSAPASNRPAPGSLTVAFAGRLVPQKRPEVFLATLVELESRGIQVTGVVFGDGPERCRLEREAERAGLDVRFRGWVQDWPSCSEGVDCLLLPSLIEGLAVVLLEARRANIVVVAPSTALGVADAIVPGVTGELTLTGSPVDLADGVVRACEIPRPFDLSGWSSRWTVTESSRLVSRVIESSIEISDGPLRFGRRATPVDDSTPVIGGQFTRRDRSLAAAPDEEEATASVKGGVPPQNPVEVLQPGE
jgi:glycosyltransferase involved in cell wall biosynthesis